MKLCCEVRPRSGLTATLAVTSLLVSCGGPAATTRAPYRPVAELEAIYGPLVAAANHPTPEQHGTGDRLGLFRERTGTLWGLPLAVAQDGTVLGCAPQTLHDAPVTDRLTAEATDIIGATNAPTGWRGGTGRLELLFRNKSGHVRWQAVASGALATGPVCWAQEPPGPQQPLQYYRLAPPAP